MGEVEKRLDKITKLVGMIQSKLLSLIKEAPDDIKAAFEVFKEEVTNITSVKDLDFLYAKLSGASGDLLL